MRHLVFVLMVAFVLISSISSYAVLDTKSADCLLYLPCNEGKGDVVGDLSKNKNDGVFVGTVKWGKGKYGSCLEFTEAGEVKCPYIPLNDKSMTICLWTQPKLAGGAEQCVFTQTQVNNTNTSLHYRIYANGTVRMGFYGNDLDAPGAAKAGEWIHLAFWLDNKAQKRRIYANGEQIAEDSGKSPYKGTAGDTMIGSWGGTGQKYNGLIDEVQIWDRALTEDELKQSMQDMTKLAVNSRGKLTSTWGNIKR